MDNNKNKNKIKFSKKTQTLINMFRNRGFNIDSHIEQCEKINLKTGNFLWTENYLKKVLLRKLEQ